MVSIEFIFSLELVQYADLGLSYNFNFNVYSKISIKIAQADQNGLVYGLVVDDKRCQNGIFTTVNRPYLPVIPGAVIRHRKRD
ncbi:unnamed protein product [Rotaria socialis]|uniref:Uncharacterized protein n=1 Tax=Rotaria socialis TaxID=392032 RepID=A0A820X457_9BILA|nr:unnamed protein product [Rotaria socialis]CAF4525478.1 unnamed protein product [Rotaria socialis]CAF4652880.1 unnamed protein product [Rotaria socialis]CAF4817648.1 unnamed protein product [Rotaria socialis]